MICIFLSAILCSCSVDIIKYDNVTEHKYFTAGNEYKISTVWRRNRAETYSVCRVI